MGRTGEQEYLRSLRERLIDRVTEKKLRKYFDEKLKCLEENRRIDTSTRLALSAIHRYRNEAYHNNKVRSETIRPVVLLLFELACDLLIVLTPSSRSVSSSDDWSDFERRFGVRAFDAPSERGTKLISNILREGLALDLTELAESLADHLENRFEEFIECLNFVGERDPESPLEKKLSDAKAWIIGESQAYEDGGPKFQETVREFTLETLGRLKEGTESMRHIHEKPTLFAAFTDLETAYEPIEECLSDLAAEVRQNHQLGN